MFQTYFSSLWIANFGVEPTLATLFFLFLPAFFFLKSLLRLVCIVLDAISISLRSSLFKFRPIFLSRILFIVKIFLLSTNYTPAAHAATKRNIKDLFISKGEQTTIKVNSMTHYAIGNKEVLSHLYKRKAQQIHLKGKSIGFSDLVIWSGKVSTTYHIYVLSKTKQLKKVQIAESLKRLGLEVKVNGEIILVEGEISNISQFFIIQKIAKYKNENLILNITLSKKLRNKIISEIYSKLYQVGAKKVICHNFKIQLHCSVEGVSIRSNQIKALSKQYNIKFNYAITNIKDKNYLVKFKIIQVETMHEYKNKLALSQISAPLLSLIKGNHISLVEGETTNISQLDVKATLLSEPQTLVTLEAPAIISLGGEIPYTSVKENTENTTWKFFGLKTKIKLTNKRGRLFVNYKANLSTPQKSANSSTATGVIQGAKGQAGIFIKRDQYIKLFEIGHNFQEDQTSGIPLLKDIPFFKYLFSSRGKYNSYKHIICFIYLKETDE